MTSSHARQPAPQPGADALTADMTGIGMNFAATPNPLADIEATLVRATEAGMGEADLRVLGMLTTWFGVHHARVHADRLVRRVADHPSVRVRACWAALATWQAKDRRFARLAHGHAGPPLDLLPVGTAFHLERRGEDPRFVGTALRVPAGTLRDRASDVLDAAALVRLHPGYANRVRFGPSWRADVWTVLERDPELSVAEAARRTGCAFATAWLVAQDFRLLRRVAPSPGGPSEGRPRGIPGAYLPKATPEDGARANDDGRRAEAGDGSATAPAWHSGKRL